MTAFKKIEENYRSAKEVYAYYGVDTDDVLKQLDSVQISLHCWQGDDVTGFEVKEGGTGGGIMATGNYPGRARNGAELRSDIDKALAMIPGKHRVNIHSIYAETGGKIVPRDELKVEHFADWISWAKQKGIGLDFNGSFFGHSLASSGYTLASDNEDIRRFWVRHGLACREISAKMGAELGTPSVNNLWIPDGSKDLNVSRMEHRQILIKSLDEIFKPQYDRRHTLDAVESKLFGIGLESYTAGSNEFYLAYALKHNLMVCFDMGHFHPTESIADKVSASLLFCDDVLLHVSRGVRWDSDHVVIMNDDLINLALEAKRSGRMDRLHFALDYFDASINRITAWVSGARSTLTALLFALCEPTEMLAKAEKSGRFGDRLAMMEAFKSLPYGAVWNKFCADRNAPVAADWLSDVSDYESSVQFKRK